MRRVFKIFILFFIFRFFGIGLFAQAVGDYRSFASGTWATVGNWERWNGTAWINPAPSAPINTDGVITIQSGHTMNIAATVTIDQVVINPGGTVNWTAGTLTIANGAGVDLQVDGTMWDNRTAGGASIAFAAGATWQMGANGTLVRSMGNSSANWQAAYQGGIATIPATSNWILRKTVAQNPSISTAGAFYGNLIIENNVAGIWTTAAGSTLSGLSNITVKGNLDIGGTGTSTVDFLNNALSVTSCNLVVGNMTVRTGNILRNYGTGFEVQGDLTINGTVNYSAGTGARKFIFSGANAQSVNGTGTFNIYDFTINKSANNLTLNRAITIDNLFTLTSGLMISTAVNLPTLNTNATVTGASNASFVSGPIRYIGNAALTFPVGKSLDYQALGISASAAGGGPFWTETFSNACVTGCTLPYTGPNGTWTLTDNSPANDACGFPLSPNTWFVSGNECGNAPGACGSVCGATDPSLHVGATTTGDLGAAYDAGGWCAFGLGGWGSGTTTDIRAESPAINCTGFTSITLTFNYIENGATTIDNATLWYFDGISWTQIADMAKTATGCGGQGIWTTYSIVLPASANGNPNVKIGFKWVNDDDGAGSDPSFAVDDIVLSVAGPVSDFTCEYFYTNPQVPYGNTLAPTLDHISNCEYWILTRNAGTENKYVTLTWDANSCLITPLATMRVARYDGISTWQDEGNSATSGSVAAGTVTSNLVTSFSPFTLGSTVAVILPIELISFNATAQDNSTVLLKWITASEINNDRFEVERSKDGTDFIYIGSVKGAGNSVIQRNYSFTDFTPYDGTSYYRLKQIDYDGKFTYTAIEPVNIENLQNIQLYPNPSNGNEIFLSLDNTEISNPDVFITDMTGKMIFPSMQTMKSSTGIYTLVFPTKLAQGSYLVTVKTAEKMVSCRLIVN